MCGINGIFAYNAAASPPDARELITSRDAMVRRGPEGSGAWWSDCRRLGLGHRRLAFFDLSEAGAQPMTSADGRHVVTFNGEIYNFPELRRALETEGVVFRTNCDTEVLLLLYSREGRAMLTRLRGMFAFAIWDSAARTLFLARDPYGIKPLYISNDGWTFRFASQVQALLAGGRVSRAPEPAGVVGFHLWGSVPEPFTLYRDIEALPAGTSMVVDATGPHSPTAFASITDAFARGAEVRVPPGEVDARVAAAVRDSVRAHLTADVDVGLFLSAGVDSCALLGMMRDAGAARIRAVTLSFAEFRGSSDDESVLAAEAATLYGAEHTVRVVSEEEFRDDLPNILEAMDQPSIDGVNTWFVAKAARELGLKTALSGLGGDELLAGYESFREIPRWNAWASGPAAVPGLGRSVRMLARAMSLGNTSPKMPAFFEYAGTYRGAYLLRRGLFLPFELADILDPAFAQRGLDRLGLSAWIRDPKPRAVQNSLTRVAALESSLYLRNQLLRDADWAGMAHSIEIRTPLVDVHLLEALAPVIPHLGGVGTGKAALANAPRTPLPPAIAARSKTGFSVPTGHWLTRATDATRRYRGMASRAWSREVYARVGGRSGSPADWRAA